jgi:GMP synthase-like glutamine amidotransferase
MKIHCIRHEPFEGLANINKWIQSNNHHLTYTHVYLNENFPLVDDFDLLIIMGGTASVYEKKSFPWLIKEKEFVQKVINEGKKVIGICLGAQMLADALESQVYKGTGKEIGWFPVEFNTSGLPELKFLPDKLKVFHWHGDTFDLPQGAVRICSSELFQNQGFVYGKNVMALQFHCEMNIDQLTMIIKGAGRDLLNKGKYIQSEKEIMEKVGLIPSTNKLMFNILDYIATD